MSVRRRLRGFERAGAVPADEMGVPPARARHLRLVRAWRRTAGEAIARRIPLRRLRAGVLEIEVPEGAWDRALEDLLPALIVRLAASHREQVVRKYRIVRPGQRGAGKASPLPDATCAVPPSEAPRCAPHVEQADLGASRDVPRLDEVMERYLARVRSRGVR